MTKTYFIDFEASSLDSGSFPIEVAWVDENGQGESYLIKPQIAWTDWSAKSEKIHGIARSTLCNDGIDAAIVARRARQVLTDAILISDNPAFDGYWLSMLLQVIYDKAELPVFSFHSLIALEIKRMAGAISALPDSRSYWHQHRILLDEGQTLVSAAIEQHTLSQRTQHRALADATDLWQKWRAARNAITAALVAPHLF